MPREIRYATPNSVRDQGKGKTLSTVPGQLRSPGGEKGPAEQGNLGVRFWKEARRSPEDGRFSPRVFNLHGSRQDSEDPAGSGALISRRRKPERNWEPVNRGGKVARGTYLPAARCKTRPRALLCNGCLWIQEHGVRPVPGSLGEYAGQG